MRKTLVPELSYLIEAQFIHFRLHHSRFHIYVNNRKKKDSVINLIPITGSMTLERVSGHFKGP